MGGNVERHIGDDDRDGAAIEALQPGGNGMTHAARDVLAERDEARAQVSASRIAGHAVGAGKGGCGRLCGYDCNGACFAPNDLIDLIGELGREVYNLLDGCETSGPIGEEIHTITEDGLRKVSAILDRIDDLPFEEPGVILGTGAMLQTAIMQMFAPPAPDAVARLGEAARAEADKAMRKYPQPNYVISKVAEEAGEVVKAAIHCAEGRETPEVVIGEIKQAMAMLIRLYIEGDQVHGLPPLAAMEASHDRA